MKTGAFSGLRCRRTRREVPSKINRSADNLTGPYNFPVLVSSRRASYALPMYPFHTRGTPPYTRLLLANVSNARWAGYVYVYVRRTCKTFVRRLREKRKRARVRIIYLRVFFPFFFLFGIVVFRSSVAVYYVISVRDDDAVDYFSALYINHKRVRSLRTTEKHKREKNGRRNMRSYEKKKKHNDDRKTFSRKSCQAT